MYDYILFLRYCPTLIVSIELYVYGEYYLLQKNIFIISERPISNVCVYITMAHYILSFSYEPVHPHNDEKIRKKI